MSSIEIHNFGSVAKYWNHASSKLQKSCKTWRILIGSEFGVLILEGFQCFSLVLIAFHERQQFGIFRSNSTCVLSRLQKTLKNMSNIDNFTMLRFIARHFCFIFIANINDFDFAELLMFIFCWKSIRHRANFEWAQTGAHLKYSFSWRIWIRNSKQLKKH